MSHVQIGIAQFKLPLPKNANPEQLINHRIVRCGRFDRPRGTGFGPQ